jgi:hypothetical protein
MHPNNGGRAWREVRLGCVRAANADTNGRKDAKEILGRDAVDGNVLGAAVERRMGDPESEIETHRTTGKLEAALQQKTLLRLDVIVTQIEDGPQVDVGSGHRTKGGIDVTRIGERKIRPVVVEGA